MATQAEVARDLGIRQRGVRELRDQGVIPDPRHATLDEIREAYICHLRKMAAGREIDRHGPKRRRDARGSIAQEVLEDLVLPRDHLIPWAHDQVMTIPEYEAEAGIAGDGVLDLICFGVPILPPARGQKVGRVSAPHGERWRFLVGALLYHLTREEPDLSRLGSELHRLRRVA